MPAILERRSNTDNIVMQVNRWSSEITIVIILSSLAALSLVFGGRLDLTTGYHSIAMFDEQFRHGQSHRGTSDHKKIEGDWQVTPGGLALYPGRGGTILIQTKKSHQGRFLVILRGSGGEGFHAALSVSREGPRFHEVAREVPLDGRPVDLTFAVDQLDQVWLKLTASVDSSTFRSMPTILTGIRVVVQIPPSSFPNVAIATLMILTPVLAYVTKAMIRPSGALVYGLMVLCGLVILAEVNARIHEASAIQWWQLVVAREHDIYLIIPYMTLLGLLGWHMKIGRGASIARENTWAGFALGGILAWGGHSRLLELAQKAWAPLDPDAITYLQFAQQMSSPYDTMTREPFWIWMIKIWSWCLGDSAVHLRLLTLMLSVFVIVAAYRFFRDYTGLPLVGIFVAWLLAVNPYLVHLSVRGLREEAYTMAILLVTYCVLVPSEKLSPLRRGISLAFAAAAAQLLRFNSYLFITPLIFLWSWRHHRSLLYAVLPLVFTTTVSVPHLIHNYRVFEDPLYSLNHMAVWSRNYEFVILKKTGCQGCPTQEEFLENSYAGPKIGTFGYLIGMHTVQELTSGMVNGFLDMYVKPTALFHMLSGTSSSLSYGLYLIGLGLVLFSPYREILVVILLVINIVPFFMSIGFEGRLAAHTAPFVSFILAYGVWWLFARLFGYQETVALRVPAWRLASALRPVRGAKTTQSLERSS